MSTIVLMVVILSFVLSFIFALGGIGSALVIVPALTWVGGYLGTIVMHQKMQPGTVKKFLGCVILLLASRLAFSL